MTCEHKNIEATVSGARHYCLDCGQFMLPPHDYHRLLQDGRKLQWRPVEGFKPKLGKVYIGAKFNPHGRIWMLSRVEWIEDIQAYAYASEGPHATPPCPIDFIAEDTLGTPPASECLPSAAA